MLCVTMTTLLLSSVFIYTYRYCCIGFTGIYLFILTNLWHPLCFIGICIHVYLFLVDVLLNLLKVSLSFSGPPKVSGNRNGIKLVV